MEEDDVLVELPNVRHHSPDTFPDHEQAAHHDPGNEEAAGCQRHDDAGHVPDPQPQVRVETREQRSVQENEEVGDMLELTGRVTPLVPPPSAHHEGQSWAAIDKVGAWESFLCRFPVLEQVPEQHKGAWAAAWGQVLTR